MYHTKCLFPCISSSQKSAFHLSSALFHPRYRSQQSSAKASPPTPILSKELNSLPQLRDILGIERNRSEIRGKIERTIANHQKLDSSLQLRQKKSETCLSNLDHIRKHSRSIFGHSPLISAVRQSDVEELSCLIEREKKRMITGHTCVSEVLVIALMVAAAEGEIECARTIISYGAVPVDARHGQFSALYFATLFGHAKFIRFLVSEMGAVLEQQHQTDPVQRTTLLHVAACFGHKDVVLALCELGSDVDCQDSAGNSPLAKAVEYGHRECCAILARQGAKFDLCDLGGNTVVTNAAAAGDSVLLQEMIGNSVADQTFLNAVMMANREGLTPLMYAAANGHTSVVLLILQACEKMRHVAKERGFDHTEEKYKAFVEDLIQLHDERSGNTALHWAARNGNSECIRSILAVSSVLFGSENSIVNLRNKRTGHTPLFDAALMDHADCIDALCRNNSQINKLILLAVDGRGKSALMIAAHHGRQRALDKLLEFGKDDLINMQDDHGRTALSDAAASGHFDCLNALLKAGADPGITDINGNTALIYSRHTKKCERCISVLEKEAAKALSEEPKGNGFLKKLLWLFSSKKKTYSAQFFIFKS